MMVPIKIERKPVMREKERNVSEKKSRKSMMIKTSIVLVALAVVFLAVSLVISNTNLLNKNKNRQAVLTSTGLVYFGYVRDKNAEIIEIDDVYYLTNPSLLTNAKPEDKISLIKMGSEGYKPTNSISINRQYVVMIQDLTGGSQINAAIVSSLNQK